MKYYAESNMIITTRDLTKNYGKSRGITDINLEITAGEFFGFIGPNGAGKSTTIRTLLGLIFPSSGSGEIFGLDIIRDSSSIKQHIGFVPSEVNLYGKMRVQELLEFSAGFYKIDGKRRIEELCSYFNLDPERKLEDLSLGNRKKAAIIQSLLHDPDLLILDEPTTGLDPLMQKRFFDLLKEENSKGKTIFLSSHTLSDVQKVCGRVAIIKEGRIIKMEDVKTLRSRHLKKISLVLKAPFKEDEWELRGISSLSGNGQDVYFLFDGDINTLLRYLGDKKLENLSIAEPELEEIFMHYYDEGDK